LGRAIDGGKPEILASEIGSEPRLGVGARQRHGEHHPGLGMIAHERATHLHQPQRVFERQDVREAGGDVFAEAVADHRARFDAPRSPELRQRVFDGEQRRLRDRGIQQPLDGPRNARRIRMHHLADVEAERIAQLMRACVDVFAIDRLARVQLGAHARILRALAGQEERHHRLGVADRAGRDTRSVTPFEPCRRGLGIAADDDPAMREGAASRLQRAGDIRDRLIGMREKMRREPIGRGVQCRFAACGDCQHMPFTFGLFRWRRGRRRGRPRG
jgi:hypothetical protein